MPKPGRIVAKARWAGRTKRKRGRKFPKSKSIRTVSGGLPSLGKRR